MSSKPNDEEREQNMDNLKQPGESLNAAPELKDIEDLHKVFLDTTGDGVIIQSAAGKILAWNKGAEEIFAVPAKDAVGRECSKWSFIREDGSVCPDADNPLIKTLRTGLPYKNLILGLQRAPGDLRWVSINTGPLYRNEEGIPCAAVITLSDVTELKRIKEAFQHQLETEQKQIEKEILRSESRFRELAELLPEAVFETDMEMNIRYVNQQAFSMFGYSMQDFESGLNGMDMLAPQDKKRAKETFIRHMQGKIPGAAEYRAVKKDGTVFPVLFQAGPIIENGAATGLRGVIIDITSTKLMEQRLVEAQKMESIGTLAGGIAHDFNNILSPIILHSEMTKNDLPEDDPLQVSIKEIYKASIRARDLVRQILTFARRGSEEKILLNASRVVKDTIKFLRATIPSTIEIRYENKAGQDTIMADPIQINQIVMNLCTNAAHAMRKKGGLLEVYLANRDITPEDMHISINPLPGRYLELTVKDSGTGISPKIVSKIFDPYFTTKGPGEGTGLGLSIIHGIVKSYGGGIIVDSIKNRGTAFRIYLPLHQGEIPEDHGEKTDTPPKGNECILLVDDEEAGVKAMQRTLSNLGYKVIPSIGSMAAYKTFCNDPAGIDLVITDMTMPGMTGKELISKFKKLKPGLPTILCTGFSDLIDENEAEKEGIDAFVMKPVIRSEIANTIRRVLGAKAI